MKIRFTLLTVVLALVLVGLAGCNLRDAVPPTAPMNVLSTLGVYGVNGTAGQYCMILYAGQDIDAGMVCVEVIDNGPTEQLCITYTTTGGWELVEAHLWVGEAITGMPQTRKGNPKVGNFPYHSGDITGQTTYTFCVGLAEFGGEAELCGAEMLTAAHAALRKDNGDGTYQYETGWGDGDRMVDRGNWATFFGIQFTCGDVPIGYSSETAFAYNCDDAARTCFIGMDDGAGGTFNRWGWTNGPLGEGTYYFDIYAGAGRCDITKGTLVGLLTVDYDGATATVTYNTCGNYTMTETHLYVGNEVLPRDVTGEFTVAPGQYPYINESLANVQTDEHVVSVSGNIYVVAHAVVWGDYSQGDCGDRGCIDPCNEWIVYGSQRASSSGDIYAIDMNTMTATLLYDIPVQLGSPMNYPNGNAYDPVNQRIYFATNTGQLYFYEIGASSHEFAGNVPGTVASGSFYNGKYYYIPQSTDDLYEVTLDSDGTVASYVKLVDYSGNNTTFSFGDIVITSDGLLYGSASHSGTPEFFTIDLNAGYAYSVIVSGSPYVADQVAFGSNGVLYSHSAGTGMFYTVDPATGDRTAISCVPGCLLLTDLASGPQCQ